MLPELQIQPGKQRCREPVMRHFILMFSVLFCASALAQAPTASPTPATAGGAIPLDAFTKFDQFGGVKLSPDGQVYAMLTGKYGRSAIVFVDVKTKKALGG